MVCNDQNRIPMITSLFLTLSDREKKMAGVAGFEPAHDEIKTRCLTAWRYPSRVNKYMVAIAGLEPATLAL